ncbi:glutathione S-transferase [Phenylobacterium immobile]|uniref:glutathione S-transferase n=1 Tax=Phenylobacterium immobile TaxID=21 RepID=UPI000B31835E|nr:glutathione S-transferase [Phenylobacterium immobile]
MSDYDLYYWPIPFRGQFVRAILAFAGKTWTEAGREAILKLKEGPIADMPAPFMGPPVLVDRATGFALSQMPAIVLYLGETLDLLPATPAGRAMTQKVVGDANDLIDDLTLDGGREMWTEARWEAFTPRLRKWMSLWEETGRRHGLTQDDGFLLGGDRPAVADIVSAVLWSTMTERFLVIAELLDDVAPMTAALSRRVMAVPSLAALAAKARADYGQTWCGGQIEASLRKVLDT